MLPPRLLIIVLLSSALLPALAWGGVPVARAAGAGYDATTELPRTAAPTHYDVSITPHAATLTFDGQATVTINVLEPTDRITLNAKDLAFSSVKLISVDGRGFPAPRVSVDRNRETATFSFPANVQAGTYHLAMNYSGRIATQGMGFFAVDCATAAGKRRTLFTQFEEAGARRFIPSWDEPAYKATFTLVATVPASELAVSNMPVANRVAAGDGLDRVVFETTPRMSTYLLFFALGDFERDTLMAGKTQLGVVTLRGKLSQARDALEDAAAILAEYNDYFGTEYPLPKLDNVAAPGRSHFSAMENWGAILSFEHVLLLDPNISTETDRVIVFAVAAHEMAHMWFGDLVTMRWWDDLWLNEGFASWMGGRTVQKLHPEWNTTFYLIRGREAAMDLDALATTHPVVQPIKSVGQARMVFDAITYSKGRAVISMLEDYVGPDKWREGVRAYIRAHAYDNATSDDLWKAIQAASREPIMDIAHDFTLQPGIPLVRVGSATCIEGRTVVELNQGEFSRDRPDKQPLTWRVPVTAATLGGGPAHTLLAGGHASLAVPGCGPLIVNVGQKGYYRTLYAPAQFDAIRRNFSHLEPIDQIGTLADSWELGMAGQQPATSFLELVQEASADSEPYLWQAIATDLVALDQLYRDEGPRQVAFRQFAIGRLQPVLARVGWEAVSGEPDAVSMLRRQLISSLGQLADPVVVTEARRRLELVAKNPAALPPALRKTVLEVAARNADSATWQKIHSMARAEKTPMVRDELYLLLALSEDPALARRALDLSLTDEPGATIASQMIRGVAAAHSDMAYDFATKHRDAVEKLIDVTDEPTFYPALAVNSLDPAMPAKLQAFARQYLTADMRRNVDAAIANVRYRIRVRDRRLPEIDAWIEAAQARPK